MYKAIYPPKYYISFVTTCKDRTWQLKQTLEENIKTAKYIYSEFIVLNVHSDDDLDEYMSSLKHSHLSYYKTSQEKSDDFNFSISKNEVAAYAQGDIICFVDADNMLLPGFAEYINDIFTHEENSVIKEITELHMI